MSAEAERKAGDERTRRRRRHLLLFLAAVGVLVLLFAGAAVAVRRRRGPDGVRILTEAEVGDAANDLVCVLGRCFNVSKGKEHYGKGRSYAGLTGRDFSRAFVSGEFDATPEPNDSLADFGPSEAGGVMHWLRFYLHENKNKYPFVGLLPGPYFDHRAKKTQALQRLEALAAKAEQWEEDQQELQKLFPSCNRKQVGSDAATLWCTVRSGGVKRTWPGVPRKVQYLDVDGQPKTRCGCVRPADDSGEAAADDTDDRLSPYEGCAPDATRCVEA